MINVVSIAGRLTKDPELRHTPNNVAVASFRIACDRDTVDKSTGVRGTDFVDVVAWRGTAEFVAKHFAKGRMIIVVGRLQMRDWTDKEGNKRTSAEVVADHVYFGDSKPDGTTTPTPSMAPGGGDAYQNTGNYSGWATQDRYQPSTYESGQLYGGSGFAGDENDDLPF